MDNFFFLFDPRKRKPQRLIDANNINLNGIIYPEGFEEFLKLVLDKQKTIEVETAYRNTTHIDDCLSYDSYDSDNPCDGCGCFGSVGCQNECPYG